MRRLSNFCSTQRTLYNGQFFSVPMVCAIEGFHCSDDVGEGVEFDVGEEG